ncbi:MAG: response regulator [Spirochaetaceae bacterium]|nr:response regulator [Spirochaetaceae bacterium]
MDDLDILIVDDDLEFGKTLSDILIIEGYASMAVATGKEGLSIVREKATYLALIDISLKDITGIDVLREIKKISPETECIMITGVASKETAIEAVNSGAFYYMQKPCDIKQLLLIIRRAVEKRKMDLMFRNSEERHRLFFENAPVGIIHYNIKGSTTDVNNNMLAILGTSRDRLIGFNANDNPDKQFTKEIYKTLKGESGHYEGLYKSCISGKEAYIKANWIPIIDDGIFMGGVGIIEDLTESKLMESQFRQAQKMEAIGELTGGIAHDFNNLLNVIQGYTELTMLDTDKADPSYKNLTKIHNSVVKAANLIRQLLIFSRRQPTKKFTILNFNVIIGEFLSMIYRLIGEDITINTCLEPELWTIRADAGNIEQLIINLAVNARDAMPDGGLLTIKTENITLDAENTRFIPYSRPGNFVRLSVEDTGTGMDVETREHIFEPFFTTKEVGKGTGLGMSVIYGIVRDHGGWINVYSELGSGTSFKIYFPVSSGISEGKIKEDFSVEDLQGNGERILLIEDEDKVRDIASAILGDNGYVIFRAHNAKRAMDIFAEENGRFHLIFCDVILPDGNGIQLTDHLLSQNSEIKILMTSGYVGNKAQRNVIQEKNFPFLQKPYSLPDLLQAFKDALK